MAVRSILRGGILLLLLLVVLTGATPAHCQPRGAVRPVLDLDRWAAKIEAGWTGKVAAGSGALPTEMWPKERIQEKFGMLTGPPQKPTSRGPLDDTTLALLGWHAARDHGPDFTMNQIAQEWVDHLEEADLRGGGFGRDFRKSVSLATMCGFDTDCNAGTVGCLLGVRNGLDAIPAEWKDPLGDTYELQVTGLARQWKISQLAREMAETGAALARGERPAPEAKKVPVVFPTQVPAPLDRPEGFGAASQGGSGGRVIVVTSLADNGPGSLREALAAEGPRIILFAVEGTIHLESRLRCTNGRVTIDGGSAPGQGITLLNHGIQFRGDCDDIIVRNLRIRVLTGGAEGDCLLFWGNQGGTVERVLVDHCSLMWATDEVVNTWGEVRDLTCQWTIIAEAQLPHSKAWLSGVGSDRVSIHHCLFADNADRVPKLEGGVYDVANNVFFNWGNNNAAKIESGGRVNLVNNWFLPGADSSPKAGCVFPADPDKGTKVYLSGNIGPYSPKGGESQWANVTWYEQVGGQWTEHRPAPDVFRAVQPLEAAAVALQSAQEAYEMVLAKAGAKVRDADDLRVIRDVRERTGRVGRNSQAAGR